MNRFNKTWIVGISFGALTACGGTGGSDTSTTLASETATELQKAGPPLAKSEENPELLDQYSCGAKKVQICHVPPGSSENRHTLCIGRAAVKSHIAHHGDETVSDYLGACVQAPPSDDGGDNGGGDLGDSTGGGSEVVSDL